MLSPDRSKIVILFHSNYPSTKTINFILLIRSYAIQYVIVGDEAFPLKTYLLRPYPGRDLSIDKRIFNYRLSRARRISENAFGLLAQRWRIFQRRINLHPEQCEKVVQACCVLHNYLQKSTGNSTPNNVQDERDSLQEYQAMQNLTNMGCRESADAYSVRDKFKVYFCMGDGEVQWQYTTVQRGFNRSI